VVAHPLEVTKEHGGGGAKRSPSDDAQTTARAIKANTGIVLKSLGPEKQAPGRPNLTGRGKHLQKA